MTGDGLNIGGLLGSLYTSANKAIADKADQFGADLGKAANAQIGHLIGDLTKTPAADVAHVAAPAMVPTTTAAGKAWYMYVAVGAAALFGLVAALAVRRS